MQLVQQLLAAGADADWKDHQVKPHQGLHAFFSALCHRMHLAYAGKHCSYFINQLFSSLHSGLPDVVNAFRKQHLIQCCVPPFQSLCG